MADSVNMSLDEIIKKNNQNRVSRNRGRGGRPNRGRGGGRGGGGRGRGRSQSRPGTPARSRSRARSQSRSRSQSRPRSGSRQRRSNSRARSRSRSRSQIRGNTPKGRAGLEDMQSGMPPLLRGRNRGRGGRGRGGLYRANSVSSLHSNVHSRLGVVTRRGAANIHRPLAVAKRGISKRGRGLSTGNRYSSVGLRSDQILQEQRQNLMAHNGSIRSQTFRRSRNNSYNANSQLTVSVINDFAKRRRNSVGNAGYLNKQSLAQLNNQQGGYNTRRGPGSVKSLGSNRSNRSNRSRGSTRGRGRGGNRGVGRNFASKRTLNLKLQKEIAAIQGKTFGSVETPNGINFSPTPAATTQTLHERFASS